MLEMKKYEGYNTGRRGSSLKKPVIVTIVRCRWRQRGNRRGQERRGGEGWRTSFASMWTLSFKKMEACLAAEITNERLRDAMLKS